MADQLCERSPPMATTTTTNGDDNRLPQLLKTFEQSLKQLRNMSQELGLNWTQSAQNSTEDSDHSNGMILSAYTETIIQTLLMAAEDAEEDGDNDDNDDSDNLMIDENGDHYHRTDEEVGGDDSSSVALKNEEVKEELVESDSDGEDSDGNDEQMVDTAIGHNPRLQQLLAMNEMYKSANHLFNPNPVAESAMSDLSPDLRLLSCAQCEFTTQDKDQLSAHSKTHAGRQRTPYGIHSTGFQRLCKDLFKCPECDEWFTTDKKLSDHQSKAHNKVVLQCIKCRFQTKDTRLFARHAQQHSNRRFVCPAPDCAAIFDDMSQLRDHSADVHNRFNCDQCDKSFKLMSTLVEHNKKCHFTQEESLLQCPICSHKYNCRTRYEKHVKSHDLSNRVQCPHCELTFEKEVALEVHVNRDHKNCRPFVCQLCQQQFYANEKLMNHLSNKHKIPVHVCDQCDYKTNSKYKMERHRVVHNPDRYKCDVRGCYLIFETKYNLIIHKKIKHQIDETDDEYDTGGTGGQPSISSQSDANTNDSDTKQTKSSSSDNGSGNSSDKRDFFSVSDFLEIDLKDGDNEQSNSSAASRGQRHETSILAKVLQKSGNGLTITPMIDEEMECEASDEDDNWSGQTRFCSVDGCDRPFTSGQDLKEHMMSDHKLIKCNKCDKCFQSFSGLYKHKRRYHRSQRQIVCRFCDKKFFYQTSYEKHIESHQKMNDRPNPKSMAVGSGGITAAIQPLLLVNKPVLKSYSCYDCNEEFAEKHNYLKHLSEMHSSYKSRQSVQRYKRVKTEVIDSQDDSQAINCLISGCNKTFATNTELNEHMRHKHAITLEPIPASTSADNSVDDQNSGDSPPNRLIGVKREPKSRSRSPEVIRIKREPTTDRESSTDFDSNFTLFTEFLAKAYGMQVTECSDRSEQTNHEFNQNLLCFECNKSFGSYDMLYRHNNEFHNKYRPKYK